MATTATAAWPTGVIARYLTVGGATVDVTSFDTAYCDGCGEDDADDRFVARTNTTQRARRWSQKHAETCR
ncbi:hypothetical protein, partial [Streptomyces sp. NPDC088178]